MRAIVTGGVGSLGMYLVQRLAREGNTVVVYDNQMKSGASRNEGLLEGVPGVESLMVDCLEVRDYGPADVIFHLAGDCSAPRSLVDPVRSFRLNAMMTCCVLEAARKQMTPVVYTSSVRAYPNKAGQRTIYGLGKWVGDLLATEYARTFGLPTISDRLGAMYGIYQHGTSESGWLAWFVTAMVEGLPLELHGGGTQQRDCLHCEDAARLLITQARYLMDTRDCSGDTFNVGGGRENFVALIEVLHYLRDKHGYSMDHVVTTAARHADVPGRPARNAFVEGAFRWKPTTSIWDGIDELVEAAQNAQT